MSPRFPMYNEKTTNYGCAIDHGQWREKIKYKCLARRCPNLRMSPRGTEGNHGGNHRASRHQNPRHQRPRHHRQSHRNKSGRSWRR